MPVAEVLARIRDPGMPVTTAVQVYVCEPPMMTPTGRYLGSVGFQRLLRRPPATKIGDCIEASVFVRPELPERELAARIAAYNMVSVAVCDGSGRLLGAVTVDDVFSDGIRADGRWKSNARPPTRLGFVRTTDPYGARSDFPSGEGAPTG